MIDSISMRLHPVDLTLAQDGSLRNGAFRINKFLNILPDTLTTWPDIFLNSYVINIGDPIMDPDGGIICDPHCKLDWKPLKIEFFNFFEKYNLKDLCDEHGNFDIMVTFMHPIKTKRKTYDGYIGADPEKSDTINLQLIVKNMESKNLIDKLMNINHDMESKNSIKDKTQIEAAKMADIKTIIDRLMNINHDMAQNLGCINETLGNWRPNNFRKNDTPQSVMEEEPKGYYGILQVLLEEFETRGNEIYNINNTIKDMLS